MLVNSLLLLFTVHCSLFTLYSCGSGDDDGSRLGEQIVGTWYRGWEEGDVEIIGDVSVAPEDFIFPWLNYSPLCCLCRCCCR